MIKRIRFAIIFIFVLSISYVFSSNVHIQPRDPADFVLDSFYDFFTSSFDIESYDEERFKAIWDEFGELNADEKQKVWKELDIDKRKNFERALSDLYGKEITGLSLSNSNIFWLDSSSFKVSDEENAHVVDFEKISRAEDLNEIDLSFNSVVYDYGDGNTFRVINGDFDPETKEIKIILENGEKSVLKWDGKGSVIKWDGKGSVFEGELEYDYELELKLNKNGEAPKITLPNGDVISSALVSLTNEKLSELSLRLDSRLRDVAERDSSFIPESLHNGLLQEGNNFVTVESLAKARKVFNEIRYIPSESKIEALELFDQVGRELQSSGGMINLYRVSSGVRLEKVTNTRISFNGDISERYFLQNGGIIQNNLGSILTGESIGVNIPDSNLRTFDSLIRTGNDLKITRNQVQDGSNSIYLFPSVRLENLEVAYDYETLNNLVPSGPVRIVTGALGNERRVLTNEIKVGSSGAISQRGPIYKRLQFDLKINYPSQPFIHARVTNGQLIIGAVTTSNVP
jgi:hypothetical protein